jgi:hypothetical protein
MTQVQRFLNNIIDPIEAVISNTQTTSEAINLQGTTIAGFYTPATINGSMATFLASYDGVNFFDVSNGTVVIEKIVAANQYITLSPVNFYGVRYLKIKMDLAQTADRTFTVIPYPI